MFEVSIRRISPNRGSFPRLLELFRAGKVVTVENSKHTIEIPLPNDILLDKVEKVVPTKTDPEPVAAAATSEIPLFYLSSTIGIRFARKEKDTSSQDLQLL